MKLINQPTNETGCGVACFAMVSGRKKYKPSLKFMGVNEWALKNGNVQVKQMLAALRDKGAYLQYSEPKDLSTCLLFVVYEDKYRHWVVRHEGLYYDPLPRYKKPRNTISYKVTRVIVLKS